MTTEWLIVSSSSMVHFMVALDISVLIYPVTPLICLGIGSGVVMQSLASFEILASLVMVAAAPQSNVTLF